MKPIVRRSLVHPLPGLLVLALWCALSEPAVAQPSSLATAFREQVLQQLQVPPEEVARYAALALEAFRQAGVVLTVSQYVAVVDRSRRCKPSWSTGFR
ncbi:hypothetical protein [Variovorax sp. PAMC 28711]|uniref:hypothetical protein n=1 Tax=Variovorax sp. PAMC 28711 TaxID=1795631 RepID=UPI001F2F0187|nr:hypothetical protein [Variovorax sp. PAMC 28711]